MPSIRKPDQFTNKFSAAETKIIASILDDIGRHLAEHGREGLASTRIYSVHDMPRDEVVASMTKKLTFRGWIPEFTPLEHGFTITLRPDSEDDESDDPYDFDDSHTRSL
jgi:hypothetical protein